MADLVAEANSRLLGGHLIPENRDIKLSRSAFASQKEFDEHREQSRFSSHAKGSPLRTSNKSSPTRASPLYGNYDTKANDPRMKEKSKSVPRNRILTRYSENKSENQRAKKQKEIYDEHFKVKVRRQIQEERHKLMMDSQHIDQLFPSQQHLQS